MVAVGSFYETTLPRSSHICSVCMLRWVAFNCCTAMFIQAFARKVTVELGPLCGTRPQAVAGSWSPSLKNSQYPILTSGAGRLETTDGQIKNDQSLISGGGKYSSGAGHRMASYSYFSAQVIRNWTNVCTKLISAEINCYMQAVIGPQACRDDDCPDVLAGGRDPAAMKMILLKEQARSSPIPVDHCPLSPPTTPRRLAWHSLASYLSTITVIAIERIVLGGLCPIRRERCRTITLRLSPGRSRPPSIPARCDHERNWHRGTCMIQWQWTVDTHAACSLCS